ncbi:phage tail protein [Gulosibacter sediminis]|uniref:phage tail protein n=1 Tax=Gulosibacter sediminis TaxID=1729695 RepID=UPI0024AE259A|nr:phage tail protein [Gulosibacter sediminis]
MPRVVDFVNVTTAGLESSPIPDALAGLRANEARYMHNKYDITFTTEPAEGTETLAWVTKILADGRKRAVGFKLSDGMDVPNELGSFKFARQKSKLAGTIRGSYFVIKGEH